MQKRGTFHIMPWAVQDWRTSKIRYRSMRTDDVMLRAFYFEVLNALWEAAGYLSDDADELADVVGLAAEECERCMTILTNKTYGRGGLVRQGGRLYNQRILEDLAEEKRYRSAKSIAGKESARRRMRAVQCAEATSVEHPSTDVEQERRPVEPPTLPYPTLPSPTLPPYSSDATDDDHDLFEPQPEENVTARLVRLADACYPDHGGFRATAGTVRLVRSAIRKGGYTETQLARAIVASTRDDWYRRQEYPLGVILQWQQRPRQGGGMTKAHLEELQQSSAYFSEAVEIVLRELGYLEAVKALGLKRLPKGGA